MGKATLLNFSGFAAASDPWMVIATKPLAAMLGTDPIAFAMRVYRGVGPKSVPSEWIKGHVAAYMASDVLRWGGDLRDDVAMFREALIPKLPDEDLRETALVRLYARVEAGRSSAILGAEFTEQGRKQYELKIWG